MNNWILESVEDLRLTKISTVVKKDEGQKKLLEDL